MHPGWLVSRAGQILEANYVIPAWVDVSSEIQNFHILEEECVIETRGRVYDKFERDGDHFIVLDLAVFAPTCCLATSATPPFSASHPMQRSSRLCLSAVSIGYPHQLSAIGSR